MHVDRGMYVCRKCTRIEIHTLSPEGLKVEPRHSNCIRLFLYVARSVHGLLGMPCIDQHLHGHAGSGGCGHLWSYSHA